MAESLDHAVNDQARWATLHKRLAEFEQRLLEGFDISPQSAPPACRNVAGNGPA